jgi:hypothetical protein
LQSEREPQLEAVSTTQRSHQRLALRQEPTGLFDLQIHFDKLGGQVRPPSRYAGRRPAIERSAQLPSKRHTSNVVLKGSNASVSRLAHMRMRAC